MVTSQLIDLFVEQARRVGRHGLTICSSGNLSWRVGEEAIISGTGSWVPELTPDKVSVCRVADGKSSMASARPWNPLSTLVSSVLVPM